MTRAFVDRAVLVEETISNPDSAVYRWYVQTYGEPADANTMQKTWAQQARTKEMVSEEVRKRL